jgi:hypothetical protein
MGPLIEAIVDGFPRAIALGQIPPRTARFCAVKDSVDERAIPNDGVRTSPIRQGLCEGLPLCVGQFMSVRHEKL